MLEYCNVACFGVGVGIAIAMEFDTDCDLFTK